MNVAAIKQVMPYARFLVRASMEKRRAGRQHTARNPLAGAHGRTPTENADGPEVRARAQLLSSPTLPATSSTGSHDRRRHRLGDRQDARARATKTRTKPRSRNWCAFQAIGR
jgi:hypothetical protein